MTSIQIIEQQLGPLAYPLAICSLLAMTILVERIVVLFRYSLSRKLLSTAIDLLNKHRSENKNLREELCQVWLQRVRNKLLFGVRPLHILALLSPLLGLLGTVFGLISVFESIGAHDGPIQPALLAEGLGVAMKTTAAGLMIALPSLLGAHGFQLWVDKLIQGLEHRMNLHNLELSGICTEVFA